eukprot:CAMPEP_0197042032 /NCGR_PEP_ID=MMETSP1384-20130603/18491_1 /TAXON_ID=29189 /ORGANISM="Ammonia sp." /LENGTH=34 /DNA_ID= /DNA_START= /DNA_END= /DNA_ORIENTATION=
MAAWAAFGILVDVQYGVKQLLEVSIDIERVSVCR